MGVCGIADGSIDGSIGSILEETNASRGTEGMLKYLSSVSGSRQPILLAWSIAVTKSEFLDEYFRVCADRNLFILGSFAKHATLYSQQVRALNLVWALDSETESGQSLRRQKVGILGAGAAGITAGAAAAIRGAEVWIWEKLQEPMELQQNNRQRWLHPTLYDWPDFNDLPTNKNYTEPSSLPLLRGDDANLPILTWSAGYATDVARQIIDQWEGIANSYPIHRNFNVALVSIHPGAKRSMGLEWRAQTAAQVSDTEQQDVDSVQRQHSKTQKQDVDVLILATGFGIETPEHGGTYWDDDAIDSAFHRDAREWIISGCGDAALMDLMRVCIHGFRQDEFLNLLLTSPGVEGLVNRLRTPGATDIEQLAIDRELTEFVKQKLRNPQPKVRLVVPKEDSLFGPRSFALNQLAALILKKLKEKDGSFRITHGRTGRVSQGLSSKFVVKVDEQFIEADRVVLRHGPQNTLAKEVKAKYTEASDLKGWDDFEKRWKGRVLAEDESRKPLWSSTFFANQQQEEDWPDTVHVDFNDSQKKFGVWADKLSIYKAVRRDGRSTVTYEINGLAVKGEQQLKAVHFYYISRAGKVENVVCYSFTKGIDVEWKSDPKDDHDLEGIRKSAREFSGTVSFSNPLCGRDRVSFSLSFRLVNGDALHRWEYEQMYPEHLRCHRDGVKYTEPIEILSRLVWFPVKKLAIRLSLPSSGCEPVTSSIFRFDDADQIGRKDVFSDSVLNYYPARRNRWFTRASENSLKAFQKPVHQPYEKGFFRRLSPRTYELSVQRPIVGSCYSVEWRVPEFPIQLLRIQHLQIQTSCIRLPRNSETTRTISGKG